MKSLWPAGPQAQVQSQSRLISGHGAPFLVWAILGDALGGDECDLRPSPPPPPETITSIYKTRFRVDVPFDLPEIFFFVALG